MSKIVFFTAALVRGGAERVITNIATHRAELGDDVTIFLTNKNKVEYNLPQNIKIISCDIENLSIFKKIFRWFNCLRKFVKTTKPDLLISFSAQVNILVFFSLFGISKKLITSERNDPKTTQTQNFITRLLSKIVYNNSTAVVFQTEKVRNYYKNIKSKSVVLPNTVSVNCNANDNKAKRIVTVGRMHPNKNHLLLIKSFLNIKDKFTDYTLEIYGDGNCRAEYEKFIIDNNLTNRVLLHNSTPNIHQQIADASLFVLSSNAEGMPNVLIEAMMMGIPVISTNCTGADELIIDGNNGRLVNMNDELQLTNAIDSALSNYEQTLKMTINAQKMVEKFKLNISLKKWDEFIDKYCK